MQWNAEMYQNKHLFVAKYGEQLLEFVNREADQTILDLGCGTGALTRELAAGGARVIGLDLSESMVEKARENEPELEFYVGDAAALTCEDRFDTIFSNAVFHWIPDQRKLIRSVKKALKKGGALVCEFGAAGNIQAIQEAFSAQMKARDMVYHSPFFFPEAGEYRRLLEEEGMSVRRILEYDRPTPLSDGEKGLRNWVVQFFTEDLGRFSQEERERILRAMEEGLRSRLWNGDQWVADYRRIQAVAVKEQ